MASGGEEQAEVGVAAIWRCPSMLSGIRTAAGGAWIGSPRDPVLVLALTNLAV